MEMVRADVIADICRLVDLDLDFEFEQPCEHHQHEGDKPAMFLVHRKECPRCKFPASERFLCLSCWEMMAPGCLCNGCHREGVRDERMKILRVIGTR